MHSLATLSSAEIPEMVTKDLPIAMDPFAVDPLLDVADRELFSLGGAIHEQVKARDLIDEAYEFLDQMVEYSYRDLSLRPHDPAAKVNYALSLINVRRGSEAKEQLRDIVARQPRNFVAMSAFGRACLIEGDLDEAEAGFRLLTREFPQNPQSFLGMAGVLLKREENELALEYLARALELRPAGADISLAMAGVLIQLSRYHEAIHVLRQASASGSLTSRLNSMLGITYMLAGEHKKATRAFRVAVTSNRRNAEAVQGYATVLMLQLKYDEAIAVLSNYVSEVTGDVDAHELLARAFWETGNSESAVRHWESALEHVSQHGPEANERRARLLNNWGVSLLALGRRPHAARMFQRSIQQSPQLPVPYQNAARMFLQDKRYGAAVDLLRVCRTHFPDDEETVLMLSYALDERGDSDAAVTELERWRESGQATEKAWSSLGYLYLESKKEPQTAISLMEEAIERWPESTRLLNNLAYAYLLDRRTVEARDLLAAIDPNTLGADVEADIVLNATNGLLLLLEGHFEAGRRGYEYAITTAKRNGLYRLAEKAEEKMHLEFAREYVRSTRFSDALNEIREGLNKPMGTRQTRRELRALADSIREQRDKS